MNEYTGMFEINRRQLLAGTAAVFAVPGVTLIPTNMAEARTVGRIAVGARPTPVARGGLSKRRFVEKPMIQPDEVLIQGRGLDQQSAIREEAFELIRLSEARSQFPGVNGTGTAAAVIDTGIRSTHLMFRRDPGWNVIKERNFSAENGGWADDAWDTHGHGSHVAGLVAGREIQIGDYLVGGIAPQANLVAIKILDSNGAGDLDVLARSLAWLRHWNDNSGRPVSAINLSLGDFGNYREKRDAVHRNRLYRNIAREIDRLVRQDIVVVCAVGNAFHYFETEGAAFPAIHEDTVSVGAVFDSDLGNVTDPSGLWQAMPAQANKIAPYSQRLSFAAAPVGTSVFAPGSSLISAGHLQDDSLAILQGTSQSAPIVTGAVLLAQQLYRGIKGRLPDPANIRDWLLQSSTTFDDTQDSVANTNHYYPVLDVKALLTATEYAANYG